MSPPFPLRVSCVNPTPPFLPLGDNVTRSRDGRGGWVSHVHSVVDLDLVAISFMAFGLVPLYRSFLLPR
jgi:hypothetical protein